MRIELEKITPSRAVMFLEKNFETNRKISESNVLKLATSMVNDDWKQNIGDTIKISKDGRLIDGQHRMTAVIKSNKTVSMYIAYDVDNDSHLYIDTNKSRTNGDILQIGGVKNATKVSVAIRIYLGLIAGNGSQSGETKVVKTISANVLFEEYQKRPEFYDIQILRATKLYGEFNMIPSCTFIAAFLIYVMDFSKHKNRLDGFCTEFFKGETHNKSILSARKKLIDNTVSYKKLPIREKNEVIVIAWRNYVTNKNDFTRTVIGSEREIIL